ncbi:MAG TPA: S8 family serine peptidase, partial [Solirubrobacteraceae bacterium]|nr:S8 family serine peptidase [Solirubrobacteraceae bacterium]
ARTWIVGARPGAATARIAARFGARPVVASEGIYVVDKRRARVFAAHLGDRLTMAEPDALGAKRAMPTDPLTPAQWWYPAVVDPNLTPPPVTPQSPSLGIIEEEIQRDHPDMQGVVSTGNGVPPDAHGTQVAGAAGAPDNEIGIVGIWPGMRIDMPVYRGVACSTITASLNRAVARGASVVNMSYGFPRTTCFAHFVATQRAFARGVVLIAAGGNEFDEGNPLQRPAVDPHVVTVAALKQDLSSSDFSNENAWIDISAPGTDVLLPTPPQFDEDGTRDGYQAVDGTSFAAPIVAAVATWLRAAGPALRAGQVNRILQDSAVDLGRRGWDQRFGYGKADMARALAALQTRVPAVDPLEPNDDAEWVNGRRLGRADPPIFGRASRLIALDAALERFEDPFDVYRAVLPPRSTVRFTLVVRAGDPDLDLYSGGTRTVTGARGLLGSSTRGGRATDVVTLRNNSRSARTVLVNPYTGGRAPRRASYRLLVRRIA